MTNKGLVETAVEKYFDEWLRENFSKQTTLLHQLRGEILELEYKNDEVMIQELLDGLDAKIKLLEAELVTKEERILFLEGQNSSLSERITALEPEEEPPM